MANVKINDMILAAVTASMQLETDIGGITPNKINISGLQTYLNANLLFAAVSHAHNIADLNNITAGKLIGDSSGTGIVGEITLGNEFNLTTGTLTIFALNGGTF